MEIFEKAKKKIHRPVDFFIYPQIKRQLVIQNDNFDVFCYHFDYFRKILQYS